MTSFTQTVNRQLTSVTSDYDYLFKILILGDSGVGKSSLLLRYADDTFTEAFIATIGVDFKIRTVTLGEKQLKLQMWDTAGQDRFRSIVSAFYRNVDGVVIVYDVTDLESFNRIETWLSEVDRYGRDHVCKVLIGNKADLKSKRVVEYDMGKALADKLNVPFLETSAKQNTNVEQCFISIATDLQKNADRDAVKAGSEKLKLKTMEGKSVDPGKCWC